MGNENGAELAARAAAAAVAVIEEAVELVMGVLLAEEVKDSRLGSFDFVIEETGDERKLNEAGL